MGVKVRSHSHCPFEEEADHSFILHSPWNDGELSFAILIYLCQLILIYPVFT